MNPARIATLLSASLLTVVAASASIDNWPAAQFLRTAAVGAWAIFAVHTSTDRILDAIAKLRGDIDTYGDQRHSDGYIDGHARQVPAQPNLQRIQ
jgi:hypothetical protein